MAWWRSRVARVTLHAGLQLCVLLLIWGSIALQLQQERHTTERDAIKETENLARAFEENIIRSTAGLDQVLLFVRDAYARDPARFDLNSWVRNRAFINDQTMQISLIDSRGLLVQSNLGGSAQPVDLSDREHFRVHRDTQEDRLFISRPLLGRVSNRYSVQFTRRIIGMDDEFLGVVVASVDPLYLAHFYEKLQIGHGFVMLVGTDGYVRVARPVPALIGQLLVEPELFSHAAEARHGSYRVAAAAMTRRPAFVSYRGVDEFPLIVAVGLDADEVFADYRQHRIQYFAAGTALSALLFCVGILLASHRRQLIGYQDALTATLANMSQGIIMVDRDRRVAVINRRVGALLGLPPPLLREGAGFDDIIRWQVEHGEFDADLAVSIPMDALLARGGLDASVPVYERTRPDGTVIEVRTSLLPRGGAVRTYTDVTERKRNVQELAAARDAAEAAGRARAQFLAVMSHEIRTPLNGIIGAAGLLLDHPLDVEEMHYVQIIRRSGGHLLQLVNDVLDFSRLDAECMELEEVPFDVRSTVGEAVDILTATAAAKALELSLTVAEDVPARAIGDPARLRQVLLNLIGNAIKFTEAGSVRVGVTCCQRDAAGMRLCFAVADTGIGIPVGALPRLFQEFSQVDGSISRRFGGSGLGLAISRRLIERMGGTMSVHSEAGKGSTFSFEIDLKETPATVPAAVAVDPATVRQLRILLVEDNATNRLIASRMVERMGHHVDAVCDGVEAVQAVRAASYDLVLMDVMMPQMDGLTATRLIRAETGPAGRVPIIGLTANAELGKQAECRTAGMNGFVSKPMTAEQLQAAIGVVMAASHAEAAEPLLDQSGLRRLARDLGEAGAAEVVQLFLAESPRMIERLTKAMQTRGLSLRREVHTLASATQSVGLRRVGLEAADIEHALDSEEVDAVRLQRLLDLLRDSVAALEQCQAALAPAAGDIT